MTAESNEQLEQALAELTAWQGPAPQIWKRALAASKSGKAGSVTRLAWLIHNRVAWPIAACIVVVALGITIAANLPHLPNSLETFSAGKRATDMHSSGQAILEASDRRQLESLGYVGDQDQDGASDTEVSGLRRRFSLGNELVRTFGRFAGGDRPTAGAGMTADSNQETTVDNIAESSLEPRQIVRKATIELLTQDVRAAFLKAAMFLNEAGGEYVQESSLTGDGPTAQANLTLRVAANRLSSLLNNLRGLGEVRGEQVSGQDVTEQVVDIEARLTNERRVEAELLELLEKRTNAPLKEILELRASLSDVRNAIERMTAQRERLGRLVSLATVLVIIRADAAPPPSRASIGTYFLNSMRTAWRKGLMFLADTTGGLLSIIVGGIIWWILLVVAIVLLGHYLRRAAHRQD